MKLDSDIRTTEIVKIDSNTVVSNEKTVKDVVKENRKIDQKEKVNEGEIVIKGKTDSLTDFRFHNVVNGDTLSDWYIKGNAEFIIKNRFKTAEKKQSDTISKESINVVAEIARKVVAQSTIKDFAESIKQTETTVKSTGFPVWIYFIGGGIVLTLGALWWFTGKTKRN